jgi:hypothetical protein
MILLGRPMCIECYVSTPGSTPPLQGLAELLRVDQGLTIWTDDTTISALAIKLIAKMETVFMVLTLTPLAGTFVLLVLVLHQ